MHTWRVSAHRYGEMEARLLSAELASIPLPDVPSAAAASPPDTEAVVAGLGASTAPAVAAVQAASERAAALTGEVGPSCQPTCSGVHVSARPGLTNCLRRLCRQCRRDLCRMLLVRWSTQQHPALASRLQCLSMLSGHAGDIVHVDLVLLQYPARMLHLAEWCATPGTCKPLSPSIVHASAHMDMQAAQGCRWFWQSRTQRWRIRLPGRPQ